MLLMVSRIRGWGLVGDGYISGAAWGFGERDSGTGGLREVE